MSGELTPGQVNVSEFIGAVKRQVLYFSREYSLTFCEIVGVFCWLDKSPKAIPGTPNPDLLRFINEISNLFLIFRTKGVSDYAMGGAIRIIADELSAEARKIEGNPDWMKE